MLLAHATPMMTLVDREPFAIFVAAGADAVAMPWFGFAGAITLLSTLYAMYQEWVRVEPAPAEATVRSEEHTSELQSLMRISYAVFCLKKKTNEHRNTRNSIHNIEQKH